MKLRLNLSTTPHPNKRPFLAGATAAGAISVLAFVILGTLAYRSWRSNRELHAEIARWQSEIRQSRAKQMELEKYFKTPEAQGVLDRSAFLNSLIDSRSFPWTKVFMDLEKTLPPGVRVVTISPRLKDGRADIQFTIGAMNDDGKIKFLKALEQSKSFAEIRVLSDKHQDAQQSADKVLMELTARYLTI